MKKLTTILVLLLACACSVCAQSDAWKKYLGHGRDSIANINQSMVWYEYGKVNNEIAAKYPQDSNHPNAFAEHPRTWDEKSYKAWRLLTRNAPLSNYAFYEAGSGIDMLRYMLYKETDPAMKLCYFDDIVEALEYSVNNLDTLKSIGAPKSRTLPDAKTILAHYYYYVGKNSVDPRGYDKQHAYELFKEAMEEVQNSSSNTEVYPYLVMEYFQSCQDLYNSDKDKYYEQYLQDYLDCTALCRHMYENKADRQEAEKGFFDYFPVVARIDTLFDESNARDRKVMEKYFKDKLEDNKDNIAYLNKAMALMARFKDYPEPDQASIGVEYSKIAYEHKDSLTHYGALMYGLAKSKEYQESFTDSATREQIRTEMRDAFSLAENLAPTNQDKAYVCYLVGQSMSVPFDLMVMNPKDPKEVNEWVKLVSAATSYYEKAIELDPGHWNVAANYKLERLYCDMANAYYGSVNDKTDENGRKTFSGYDKETRETAATTYRVAADYYQKTFDAADVAYNNRCYEQDGKNMNYYQQNAANFGMNAENNAKKISSSINNVLNQANKARRGAQQATRSTCTEKWHAHLREQAFFQGRAQKCIGCGRMIQ